MNLEELEKIDSRKMFKVYDEWDKIARKYYEHEFVKPNYKDIYAPNILQFAAS